MSLEGNRAVKVSSGILKPEDEIALYSKEAFVYYNMLNECDTRLTSMIALRNISKLEYDIMYNNSCLKYEKLFFQELRAKKREKIYNDQISEFSKNYIGNYHPYNPYLQKYNGAYLRTYQLFE